MTQVIETVAELQAQATAWRVGGQSVGMVPTMGALHRGHLGLVRAARAESDQVIVSIFVNPAQFNQSADLEAYPRTFEADARMLAAAGVDVIFHPTVAEMYPQGLDATRVRPGRVAGLFEGEHRPGHFAGVATVVARLLNAGLPHRAYFGRKDAQQLAVIRAMVRDLAIPVVIVDRPTYREADGLAMSSRNRRLDPVARRASAALVRALAAAQRAYANGSRDLGAIGEVVIRVLASERQVEVEYAALVDPRAFRPASSAAPDTLVVIAAEVGGVRLIDNAALGAADVLRFAPEEPSVPRIEVSPRSHPPTANGVPA